jgi:hypothetical protein
MEVVEDKISLFVFKDLNASHILDTFVSELNNKC